MKGLFRFGGLFIAVAVLSAACGSSSAECPNGGKKNLMGECVKYDAGEIASLTAGENDTGKGGTDGDTGADGDAGSEEDADLDGETGTEGDASTEGDGSETEATGDATETDGYGITWIAVPAGSFELGCVPQDLRCKDAEKPRHTVTVPAFKMAQTEITQAQYKALIGTNPSVFQPPQYDECPDCPVDGVTWDQAKAFCETVNGRLPSEAEWEYAVRAGTTTIYYCGDDSICLNDIAWYYATSSYYTHAVKGKTPNSLGFYDMLGNVWEWTADCWHDAFDGAPSDGGVWEAEQCSNRVLRGGDWYENWYETLRTSAREYNPHDTAATTYGFCHGFRCAKD